MIILLGGVIPLGVGVLPEVGDVFVCDVAVEEKVGNVVVLRSIGGIQLVGMEVEPSDKLLLGR